MSNSKSYFDGVTDLFSKLTNRRKASNRNAVTCRRLTDYEKREMYKTGVMSRIFDLKSTYALNGTLQFETTADKEFYNNRLSNAVKKAFRFSLGYGRGVIVLFNKNDDLSEPLTLGRDDYEVRVFSGDIAKGNNPDVDLRSSRYYKPKNYTIRGYNVHHSRVIDFTYYEPPEEEAPDYEYGGISESERVYEQFVNDGVIQRAAGTIIDKASTFIYKIKGYKEALRMKKDSDIQKYVSSSEDGRSIYGALLVDDEDNVDVLTQSLADVDKLDTISLRRLAMVTGIGMTILVGEQANGLNATGQSERQVFQDTIESMQGSYIQPNLEAISKIFGLGKICFKENQGQTPEQKADYETKVIANAKVLWEIGEDATGYLQGKDILEVDDWESFWKEGQGDAQETQPQQPDETLAGLLNGE